MRSHFRLCRLALSRLRYLCFDIFLRRFLTSDPMQKPHKVLGKPFSMVAAMAT